MTRSSSRALVIVEWLLLAALLIAFVVQGFLPGWRTTNTDFPNYFLPAALHHAGASIDRAYEWRWFQRHKDYFQIDQPLVGFAPHPPLCALPMLPLAELPSLEAKHVWLALNLAFLGFSLWLLSRGLELPWRRILLLTFLCVLPLRENFLYGQYYAVILLLLSLAYHAACRERRIVSGAILATAASLKIFPAFFLILFVRKRNWRAAAGLVCGGAALASVSVLLFGWNVHKVYLLEVLPRALHGDLVGPYVLQWNSFTALCHRAFLVEPELNPAPGFNSTTTYAWVQALVATVLLFSFLFSTGDEETPQTRAWEWATFLPLLILLSSMPTAYHHCVLILTVIVAAGFLTRRGNWHAALAMVVLFAVSCYPLPGYAWLNLQGRLLGVFLLYLVLLLKAPARADARFRGPLLVSAIVFLAVLTGSNLRALRNRAEDFPRRLSPVSVGYGSFAVARAGDRLVLDEMLPDSYAAIVLPEGTRQPMPVPGDVLAIAGSKDSPFVYFELTNARSQIFRLPVAQLGHSNALPEYVAEGYDPAVSPDGRWLAYLREGRSEGGRTTIWLAADGAPAVPLTASQNLDGVLEMSLTSQGSLIVATGSPADPYLVRLDPPSGEIRPLTQIPGAVRYPAVSPDGNLLAFSRRESGAWHLFLRDLESGREQQLTSAACNATSPSWEDERNLLYMSDCGRGLGLDAPARVVLRPTAKFAEDPQPANNDPSSR